MPGACTNYPGTGRHQTTAEAGSTRHVRIGPTEKRWIDSSLWSGRVADNIPLMAGRTRRLDIEHEANDFAARLVGLPIERAVQRVSEHPNLRVDFIPDGRSVSLIERVGYVTVWVAQGRVTAVETGRRRRQADILSEASDLAAELVGLPIRVAEQRVSEHPALEVDFVPDGQPVPAVFRVGALTAWAIGGQNSGGVDTVPAPSTK